MTDEQFRAAFDKMTPEERHRYGEPSEWRLEGRVGPRARGGDTAQFSVRVPRGEVEALRNLAAHRGVTFSELVREAIASQLRPPARDETQWLFRITSSRVREISYRSDEIVRDRTTYIADGATQQPEPSTGVPQSA